MKVCGFLSSALRSSCAFVLAHDTIVSVIDTSRICHPPPPRGAHYVEGLASVEEGWSSNKEVTTIRLTLP